MVIAQLRVQGTIQQSKVFQMQLAVGNNMYAYTGYSSPQLFALHAVLKSLYDVQSSLEFGLKRELVRLK